MAADEALPIGAVTLFVLIADLLVTDAFLHAFPPGRGGPIAVSFTAAQEALAGLGTLADYHSGYLDQRPSVGNRLGRRSAGNEEK